MEYHSPWPEVPLTAGSLYDLLFEGLTDTDAARVAFDHVETGQVVTFGQLHHDVDALASWLAARAMGDGDVIAVMLRNRPEYAVAFHGILRGGATITPVSVSATEPELVRQLTLTGASLMVTSVEFERLVRAAMRTVGLPADWLVLLDTTVDPAPGVRWEQVIATRRALPALDLDPATHVACLPMSSGTAGLPKAVMLSERNLIANILQFSPALGELPDDASMVSFLPYSHIYAMTTQLNTALLRRMTQYTMGSFQAHLFLDVIATRRPTVLFIVPTVAVMVARSRALEHTDWSSVQVVVCGAAPLDPQVGRRLQERLDVRLLEGMGLTETSPVVAVTAVDHPEWPVGTVGPPVASTRIRVVDPRTGHDVEPAGPGKWTAPGEMWVAGPQVMLGYLGGGAPTQAVPDDGWLRTGDLVQADERGVLRVVGRLKELIKRGGHQIAPAELEALLSRHPAVTDAAVVGVGLPNGDEAPMALLVLDGDGARLVGEVLSWANDQLDPHKRVFRARVVDALPRSGAGKLRRADLLPLLGRPPQGAGPRGGRGTRPAPSPDR